MKLALLIKDIESNYLKKTLPSLRVGSIVRVGVIIQEGDKKRVQPYTGLLEKYHKAGLNSTITVGRFAKGIRVNRIFPIHSPDIQTIEIIAEKKPKTVNQNH